MSQPLKPWTVKLLEVLADGKWHTLDELAAKAGPLIPPGRAMREREYDRARLAKMARRTDKTSPKPERSTEYYLAVGRRSIIRSTVRGLAGVEARKNDNGGTWYRRRSSSNEPQERHP